MTKNLPKILQSSENSENLSLTVKGLLVILMMYIIKQAGYEAGTNEVLILAEGIISIGAVLITCLGIIRKIINKDRIGR